MLIKLALLSSIASCAQFGGIAKKLADNYIEELVYKEPVCTMESYVVEESSWKNMWNEKTGEREVCE